MLVALCAAPRARAETPYATPPSPSPFAYLIESETLTGDWGGLRSYIHQHGVDFRFSLTQYGTGAVSGPGSKTFVYSGRGDLYLNVDGHKLGLWPGLFITSHTQFRFGESTSRIGGQVLPVNTGASFPAASGTEVALSALLVTQAFSENFFITLGRFDTIDLAETWFTGGYGVTKFMNISLVGPPAAARVLPASTYGGAATAKVWGGTELTFAVFGSQGSQTNYDIADSFENGVTFLGTAKVPWTVWNRRGQVILSAIGSTLRANTLTQTDRVLLNAVFPRLDLPVEQVRGSWYLSAQVEQYLVTNPANPKQGFGLFVLGALTDGDPAPIKWAVFAGIGGNSPIPGRWDDTFGIGYFYNGLSNALKDSLAPLARLRDSQGFEAYYNLALTTWFRVTADVQVVSPSIGGSAATVLTFRGELRF
jgi:porin